MSKLITSLLCFFLPMLMLAQPREVSGNLNDKSGEPLLVVKESCDSLTVWLPQNVEFIRLYTQMKTPRTSVEKTAFGNASYPIMYLIRLEDARQYPIKYKLMRGTAKTIRKFSVDRICFEGFELLHIGNMRDDAIAQRASASVSELPGHDYGRRDTPVYYYRRIKR